MGKIVSRVMSIKMTKNKNDCESSTLSIKLQGHVEEIYPYENDK